MKGLLKQMKRRRHACKGCLGTQQASAEIIEAGIQSWRRCSGDVTNANGIAGYDIYQANYTLPANTAVPKVTATSNNPAVKVSVTQAATRADKAVVKFDYKGLVKTYNVMPASE